MTVRRLLRYPELKQRGIQYTPEHLARLEKQGRFPYRVKLSHRCVAWFEDEIDNYMAELAAARNGEAA